MYLDTTALFPRLGSAPAVSYSPWYSTWYSLKWADPACWFLRKSYREKREIPCSWPRKLFFMQILTCSITYVSKRQNVKLLKNSFNYNVCCELFIFFVDYISFHSLFQCYYENKYREKRAFIMSICKGSFREHNMKLSIKNISST